MRIHYLAQAQQSVAIEQVAAALAGGSVLVIAPGVLAQAAPDPVTEVNNLVTNLGTITGGVITVMIGAIGVRLAIKVISRNICTRCWSGSSVWGRGASRCAPTPMVFSLPEIT